jgi:hypothetical protein
MHPSPPPAAVARRQHIKFKAHPMILPGRALVEYALLLQFSPLDRYYPHPYFVNKPIVFWRLQAWFRCKIVKKKELFAKSSRIRSYATFMPPGSASG